MINYLIYWILYFIEFNKKYKVGYDLIYNKSKINILAITNTKVKFHIATYDIFNKTTFDQISCFQKSLFLKNYKNYKDGSNTIRMKKLSKLDEI